MSFTDTPPITGRRSAGTPGGEKRQKITDVGVALTAILIALGVLFMVTALAATSAADVIFKALLYNHATGRSVPANIDQALFNDAFRAKKS